MRVYTLRFKKHLNERGYWNTCIYAENDEDAIKQVKDKLINEPNKYYKPKLIAQVFKEREVWKGE